MSLFNDILKKPTKAAALSTTQSSQNVQTQWLKREVNQHPRLTPQQITIALTNAEQGHLITMLDLFDDIIEKNGQIRAEMPMRMEYITKYPWAIVPPDNASATEKKIALNCEAIIKNIPDFEDVLLHCAKAVFYPFACSEIVWDWDSTNSQRIPLRIYPRKAQWFQLPLDNKESITLRDGSAQGQALWQGGWLCHKHGGGEIARLGLLRTLIWYAMFSSYSLTDWSEYNDIHGLPIILAKYSGDNEELITKVEQVLHDIGHKSRGVVPNAINIEFHEASKNNANPFQAMLSYCDSMISKVISHGSLNTGVGDGTNTNALGKVHASNQINAVLSDIRQYESTLTEQLVMAILYFNGWLTDARRYPQFKFNTKEKADILVFSQALKPLVEVGARIPVNWINGECGIPYAKDGEAILKIIDVNNNPIDNNQQDQ